MPILPIVMLVILLLFGLFFLFVIKNQEKKSSVLNNSSNKDSKKQNINEKKANVQRDDVFNFMEFDKISDNMVIQNKGTKFTMMIQCKGINYDLMSDVEQLSVEEGFITFLNTLRTPIQLYVQAQNLDLKGTIREYKDNISHIRDEFEVANEEYNRVNEAFDSTKEEIKRVEKERNKILNVYEYASDIVNYVERISLNKSLLQRNFYVIVSYHSSEITSLDRFSKDEIMNICYNELVTRAQSIINGLAACSVSGRILNSNEIADVLYTAYNRDDKGLMSVREALDSGFYRLYSTTEDIFSKKQSKLQEEINNEAKIKALEALKESLRDGSYISPRIEQLDIEEQISKKASDIVRREDVPIDIKEKANQKLIEEFRKTKKDLLEKATDEYQDLVNVLDVKLDEEIKEEKKQDESKKEDEKNSSIASDDKDENLNQNKTTQSDKLSSDSEKPIVKKIEMDDKNFEYSKTIQKTGKVNSSSDFDDRLGSSETDSIV